MPQNKKLLRVGTPTTLSALVTMLNAIDVEQYPNAIVKHHAGELIIEVPQASLLDESAGDT